MGCSCSNINSTISGVTLHSYILLKPFATCPLCASKHLDYAFIKYQSDKQRAIANLYLAYKHLDRYFDNEAKQVFDLIIKYFNNNLVIEDIELYMDKLHLLATEYLESNTKFENHDNLNLEKDLNNFDRTILNLLAANELFNFEVGYKDINTPYCIGLLQESAEYISFSNLQDKIRNIWKFMEENNKLISDDIFQIIDEIIYLKEKLNT